MKKLVFLSFIYILVLVSCKVENDTTSTDKDPKDTTSTDNNPKDTTSTDNNPKDTTSIDTSFISAKAVIAGIWTVHYTGVLQEQVLVLDVSNDYITVNGKKSDTTIFNRNNAKFTVVPGGYKSSYDITFSDANNFSGKYIYTASGISNPTQVVTGVRKK